ncbi:hypothetical protein L7F22_065887 [Adiantum nelumboides]|nr:hypothetical protein [Adiantum nelumboides]
MTASFPTQGIPACLWRRTGEIYKGNKEFAELVGVGIEALREGRCTIYELMEEESAVNYWEKYGAVSFDPGQKAVLTSCVLKTRAKTSSTESSSSEVFSSSISADGGAGSERNAGQGLGSGRASGEASLNVSGTATPSHGKVDASLNSTPGPVAAAQSSQKETGRASYSVLLLIYDPQRRLEYPLPHRGQLSALETVDDPALLLPLGSHEKLFLHCCC